MSKCLSCGISVPATEICMNCANETGQLREFEIILKRFVDWSIRMDHVPSEMAEKAALEYMKTMPAWQNHPDLLVRLDELKTDTA